MPITVCLAPASIGSTVSRLQEVKVWLRAPSLPGLVSRILRIYIEPDVLRWMKWTVTNGDVFEVIRVKSCFQSNTSFPRAEISRAQSDVAIPSHGKEVENLP